MIPYRTHFKFVFEHPTCDSGMLSAGVPEQAPDSLKIVYFNKG